MIVVADTTPINYLILIGEIDVLPKLYGHVIIPPAVHEELTNFRTPASVLTWMLQPPDWLKVLAPAPVSDPALAKLDAGEREAITLAEQLSGSPNSIQLIVDEHLGRREAERRGLLVIGTIGVLREASEEGLLDLRAAIERLRLTSFHISPAILAWLLGERL
jgi:predicted nucleic acid-binding protein